MTMLSVIIITKNEQDNIRRCLNSVAWADEIIIVDSGSSDNTLDICRQYTQNITQTDWPGFGPQKNRALDKASGDWVLSIDADETISDELASEIQQTIRQTNTADAYEIKRRVIFYDTIIKHTLSTDSPLRLFKRGAGRFTDVPVHEKVAATGKVSCLQHIMYHYSFKDIDQLLTKMNQYSSLSAQMKFDKGKKPAALSAFVNAVWTFLRLYIFKGGFLDGKSGLVLAVSFAEGAFYRSIKCSFLHNKIQDQHDVVNSLSDS